MTTRIGYVARDTCPACGARGREIDRLDPGTYTFGRERIAYPPGGMVPIDACTACDLVYKRLVPEAADLSRILARRATEVWRTGPGGYEGIHRLVDAHAPAGSLDILDVGAGDGGMLGLFSGREGRRSALDVHPNPSLRNALRGEFIQGMVEDRVRWSGMPYDVVLAFDVLEHFYSPHRALDNLHAFLRPGGVLVAQTGDADHPGRTGGRLGSWWYINLFEHHLVWNEQSLRAAAARHGFTVRALERTRHKANEAMPAWKRAAVGLLHPMGQIPPARALLWRVLGRDVRLLGEPSATDHLTVVLARTGARSW